MASLSRRSQPRFALYETERPSWAVGLFHEYLRDLGLAKDARARAPAALVAISNWATPSTISARSLAVEEALLNSSLNTVGLDVLFWFVFLTSLGAGQTRTSVQN